MLGDGLAPNGVQDIVVATITSPESPGFLRTPGCAPFAASGGRTAAAGPRESHHNTARGAGMHLRLPPGGVPYYVAGRSEAIRAVSVAAKLIVQSED